MIAIAALAGALAFVLTGWLRRYALARNVLDVPNARSSHAVPTPRGGGLAIVVATVTAVALLAWRGAIPGAVAIALVGAGVAVAAVGWLDDHGGVRVRWRLLVHFGAAAWAVAWLGGLPALELFGTTVDAGLAGDALAVLFLVWLLNLYNFMDGIDGIAGIEAVAVCAGGIVVAALAGTGPATRALPLAIAAAVLGFLLWNFPRARIFMGDVGSGFTGIVLGIAALAAATEVPGLFWTWVVLLGTFVVDATFTLVRRLARRERVYEAHRSHAYQHLARRLGSHVPVSLAYGAVTLMWLLPVAALVGTGRLDGAAGTLLAYAPLAGLAAWLGAGRPESTTGAGNPSFRNEQ